VEEHSSRLEQSEYRISELEGEMEINIKTEEQLVKQLKTCERICRNSPTQSKDKR
jgi:hypothetical protein